MTKVKKKEKRDEPKSIKFQPSFGEQPEPANQDCVQCEYCNRIFNGGISLLTHLHQYHGGPRDAAYLDLLLGRAHIGVKSFLTPNRIGTRANAETEEEDYMTQK